jgi:hypothetical protein
MSKVRINKRKEYKEQLRLFITLSNNVRKKIRKHFKDYGDLAESLFDDIGEVPNEYYDDYYNEMLTILSASAREVIITMGNRLHRTRISKKSDEIDPVIIDYVGTQTAQNVRNITETTRRAIQAEISLGLETGLSNPQISKNIRKSTGFSPKRATLIARTETHQAMNYGNQKVAERLGLKKPIKEWASALDERARSWHVNMNGVQVGIDEPFKIMTPVAGGGVVEKELQYAGDANGGATNVINCRCFVIYYDEEDLTTGDTTTREIVEPESEPTIAILDRQPDSTAINPTSVSKPITGSALTIESGAKVRKELKERMKTNNADPRYKIFRDDVRGKVVNKGNGKVTSTLSKYTDRELTELKVIMDELDELADFYGIPRIAGLGGEGNYVASMGYGVFNINKKYYDAGNQSSFTKYWNPRENQFVDQDFLNKYKKIEFSDYKLGETKYGKGNVFFGVSDYTVDKRIFSNPDLIDEKAIQDLSLAQKRAVAYHEFAHHLHHSFKTGTKTVTRTEFRRTTTGITSEQVERVVPDKQLETKLRKELTKLRRTVEIESRQKNGSSVLFPSLYSSENELEWFAENFSAHHMGFKDKVSPYFTKFLEKEVLSQIDS